MKDAIRIYPDNIREFLKNLKSVSPALNKGPEYESHIRVHRR